MTPDDASAGSFLTRARLEKEADDTSSRVITSRTGSLDSAGHAVSEEKDKSKVPEIVDPRLKNLRMWKKGQSGNPAGRKKIEPRVRAFARKYDKRMCEILAAIAEDPEVAPSERRKAAMDLIAVGSGRPALLQEIAGRNGSPLGPLVNLNVGTAPGGQLSPEEAYRLMAESVIPADPHHEAFQPRLPAIESDAGEQSP